MQLVNLILVLQKFFDYRSTTAGRLGIALFSEHSKHCLLNTLGTDLNSVLLLIFSRTKYW